MKARRWIAILVVLVIIVAASVILTKKQDTAPEVGHVAPNFTLTTLAGQTLNLAQFRGKPVYLNFFASWCPPCQFETPDVEKMYKKYGNKITFIGVNLAFNDTVPRLKKFLKTYGVTYPVLLDKSGSVTKTYKVMAIPTSFFIKSNGVIMYHYLGALIAPQMQTEFNKLLASS
jgi:peroxiredoxin